MGHGTETGDPGTFERLAGATDPALVVVTTALGTERAGCLVGFHGQASIDPERYCVWLSKANHTYRVALRAPRLAVHFLTSDDLELAADFGTRSGENTDKFAGLGVSGDRWGVPVLDACANRMLLERIAILDDGGDHVCMTARVLAAESGGGFTPLRVSDASGLDAGRSADQRAIEP